MNQKQLKKTLISTIATMTAIVAILICASASWAWFSANRNVNSSGMAMQIEASANLVIAPDASSIAASGYLTTDIAFSESEYPLLTPATHDFTVGTTTGLKYVTNKEVINLRSGIQDTGAGAIQYEEAQNVTDGTQYYVDYDVYIASSGKALENATLKAVIDSAQYNDDDTMTDIESGSLMAASVDIYADSISSANYKGTLNVAGMDIAADYPADYDASATKTEVYLVGSGSTTGTIPLNTSASLHYVLRFYFDGALQSAAGKTYVNTAELDCSQMLLGLKFIATEETGD